MKNLFLLVLPAVLTFNALHAQKDTTDSGRVYSMFDISFPPSFPGGEKELLRFLKENVRYPEKARKMDIQGDVAVDFIIDENGKTGGGRIVKDIGEGCANEVLRALNLMPNWSPGKVDGKPVKVRFVLPVRFILEGQDEKDATREEDYNKPAKVSRYYTLPTGTINNQVINIRLKVSEPLKKVDKNAKQRVHTGVISEKECITYDYKFLDTGMCSIRFNPDKWDDDFFAGISDPEYPDSLQSVPDQMPMFPHGLQGLYRQLNFYVHYPKEVRQKKLSARIIMAVDIDNTGKIVNVYTIKSEHPDFARAAEEVLYQYMPLLYPAVKNGVFAPVRLYIPVRLSAN